jgi:hypothetical protein
MWRTYRRIEDWMFRNASDEDYWRLRVPVRFVLGMVIAVIVGIVTVVDRIQWYFDVAILLAAILVGGLRYVIQVSRKPPPIDQTHHYAGEIPERNYTQTGGNNMNDDDTSFSSSPRRPRAAEVSEPPPVQQPRPPVEEEPKEERLKVTLSKEIRESLSADELVRYTNRLHGFKLIPRLLVVALGAACLLFFYVLLEQQWGWKVPIIAAYGVLVGIPIYGRLRDMYSRAKLIPVIAMSAFLIIVGVLLAYFEYLDDIANGIVDGTRWVLETLSLDSWTFETVMEAFLLISIVQFAIKFAEWYTRPVVVTNHRLIFTYGLMFPRSVSAMLAKLTEESVQGYKVVPGFRLFGFSGVSLPFVSLLVEAQGSNPKEGVTRVNWFPTELLSKIRTGVATPN